MIAAPLAGHLRLNGPHVTMKVALTPVPAGLLALDPQLICYSWITGISEVAEVVFVRKRLVEIQYLKTTITDEQTQRVWRYRP
jgi:hypothetical protein